MERRGYHLPTHELDAIAGREVRVTPPIYGANPKSASSSVRFPQSRCTYLCAAVAGVPAAWVAQRLSAVLSAHRGVSGRAHDGRPNEAGPVRHQGRTLVQITSRGKRVRFRLPAHSAPTRLKGQVHMGRTTSAHGWGRMSFAQIQPI